MPCSEGLNLGMVPTWLMHSPSRSRKVGSYVLPTSLTFHSPDCEIALLGALQPSQSLRGGINQVAFGT